MKFTFKKEKSETGLRAVGNPYPDTLIRISKGKHVGSIVAPNWQTEDNLWRIRLLVKDDDSNAGFRWVRLVAKFETEPEARAFLNSKYAELRAKYDLYEMEDDPE